MAICELPADYKNETEMRRVLHVVNHPTIKGFKSDIQKRSFAHKPKFINQKMRKAQVRIGRMHELCRRYKWGQHDRETKNLVTKLYGEEEDNVLTLDKVEDDLRRQEARQLQEEDLSAKNAINNRKKQHETQREGKCRHQLRQQLASPIPRIKLQRFFMAIGRSYGISRNGMMMRNRPKSSASLKCLQMRSRMSKSLKDDQQFIALESD